ncbi:MAG: beta-galactosidase [Cyclobacteriaceae bacterium]
MNRCNWILIIAIFSISYSGYSQTLEEIVNDRINVLDSLITASESSEIDALKEKQTIRTAEIFLGYADWDEQNVSLNTSYFEKDHHYKDNAEEMAKLLADFERQDIITMLDSGIATLERLIDKSINRVTAPNIDWSNVSHDGDQLTFEGRPVFLAGWTWKPKSDFYWDYHGQLDGHFITPGYVTDESGQINSNQSAELEAKPSGTMGFIFINNRNVPEWAKTKYGDAFVIKDPDAVRYTEYDIDHPGARELMGALIGGMAPQMSNKQYAGLGYMMCNEPHFINTKKANGELEWASSGVSTYTMDSFRVWLQKKHLVISNLNTLWNTSFNDFEDVQLEIPISVAMQGTAQWFDWMSFNMDRVSNWYTFMKDTIKKSDPHAKVHLKLIPGMWTEGDRSNGLDFEVLTKMSDVIGNDTGAEHRSFPWRTDPWEERYIFEWREMAMAHDFFKSISPNKIMFNSESHYLSTKASINLYLDPGHARATYWLAHTQGMSGSQTWFWARREDGSTRSEAGGYAASNNHQPRVVNEVHSTLLDLNSHSEIIMTYQRQRKPIRIFYSKAASINDAEYMDHIFDLYESLYFEGVPLGFVTEDILKTQSKDNWDVVLVYKTENVSEGEVEALQAYVDGGGKVIIDALSFKKDEYDRSIDGITGGTLVAEAGGMAEKALNIVRDGGNGPEVTVTESSSADFPICTWKSAKNQSGHQVISMVNVGKVNARVTLRLNGATKGTTTRDVLKGIDIANTQTLKPYDVLFVELRDEESTIKEILQLNDITPEMRLFPNPSTGKFNLGFGSIQQSVDIHVLDINGRQVLTQQIDSQDETTIDLSFAKSGMYIVRVSGSMDEKTFRFLKVD